MNRFASILLAFLLGVLLCHAADHELYPGTPIDFQPGIIAVDTLPEHPASLDYHIRITAAKQTRPVQWGVELHYVDGRMTSIRLSVISDPADDVHYAAPMQLQITSFSADSALLSSVDATISDGVDPTVDGWSLLLAKTPADRKIMCSVGQRASLYNIELGAAGLRTITSVAFTHVKLLRLSLLASDNGYPYSNRIADLDSLRRRLNDSSNPAESYWRYLDRDTDPARLNTAANYRLATVCNSDDNSIEIIYIGDDNGRVSDWTPGMLKGRLVPTVFLNHYDLIWYDAFGNRIDSESSADIIDGAILKLNFPLHGGTIRFQKDLTAPARHPIP